VSGRPVGAPAGPGRAGAPGSIVAYTASPGVGGTEMWISLLLAGLQRRGHRVAFFCRFPFIVDTIRGYGVEARLVRLGGDVMLPHMLRFASLLRRHGATALMVGSFRKLWQASLAARMARVPRVVARVGISTDVPQRLKYHVALRRLVDRAAVNADAMRRQFLADVPDLDPAKVITIYDGVVEPPRTRPSGSLRAELGLPADARVIGAVGRLATQKRYDRLVRALAMLPENVHCVLAGEGVEQSAIESLAVELGVRERLHMLGFRSDVGDVLDALDVFVICSDFEGMANAMLEAIAAGVPVVSTPVSGADEALDPLPGGDAPGEIVGFEPAELGAALRRLLAGDALRGRMRDAALRRWRERFSFERMLDQWEALLTGDLRDVRHEGPLDAGRAGVGLVRRVHRGAG
jgi:glycosyltransferase involved in cell wall biosynthesis